MDIQEAIRDYASRHNCLEGPGLLAEFTGTSQATVFEWLRGERLPAGNSLIGLQVYLDSLGYELEEFRSLPDLAQTLARLLAFGVLTLEEVAEELNYQSVKDVQRILLQGKSMFQQRVNMLRRLVETHQDELLLRQQTWQEKFRTLWEGQPDTQQRNDRTGVVTQLSDSEVIKLATVLNSVVELESLLEDNAHESLRHYVADVYGDRLRTIAEQLQKSA